MVHFPPLPSPAYVFSGRYSGMSQSGFPHSEIPGSKPACGSPRLIAACHVLHRLLAPRHSPYALSSLTKCSLHLTALCVVKKTTDCRIFSCQKTAKKLVRLARSTFARRATADNLRWLANRSNARCQALRRLVENTGIEPVTSWLQTRRSPS
jgi:hypothetical protein